MTESDHDLLMLAAKVAGIGPLSWIETDGTKIVTNLRWNPLTDDGDALRLAVRCAQMFGFYRFLRAWLVAMGTEYGDPSDPVAATRRAIVRAAAEIGKNMK